MSILIGFLYVVQVIVCLLLALVVMLQKPKEGGLNSAIGGGALEASLGADAANVLIKTTAVLGAILLINTLVLARLTSTVHSKSLMAAEAEPAPQTEQVAPQLPMTPPAPAAKPAVPAPAAQKPVAKPAAPAPAAKPAAPAPAAKPAAQKPVAKPAAPASAAKPAAPAAKK